MQQVRSSVETGVRVLVLIGIAYLCFRILEPFMLLILWGLILAVALHPLHRLVASKLDEREGLAALIVVLALVVVMTVPVIQISISIIDTGRDIATSLTAGEIEVPPPNESLKSVPLIGESAYEFWVDAQGDLAAAVAQFEPQLRELGQRAFASIGSLGVTLLTFLLSLVIAGFLLPRSKDGHAFTKRFMKRLAGPRGEGLANVAMQTVRSVAQGVVGIALIQSFLLGIGMMVMEIPGAGIWALAALMLAITQLPVLIVTIPVIAYAFVTFDLLPTLIFAVYMILVGMSDIFLKPLMLGLGVKIPMPVILLGAIGGVLVFGILGLFTGPVILSIAYSLFNEWLDEPPEEPAETK